MERLWAPWRSQYIAGFADEEDKQACVFCDARDASNDDERYVVWRHEHSLAMLNLYPYNSGHLLLIPKAHTHSLHSLSDESYSELFHLVRLWMSVLEDTIHPQGFNIGSNIGRVGGAGIDQHVHMHIVPRWSGDANFMPVVGNTKVISEDLHSTMMKLRDGLSRRTKTPT